MGESLEPRRRPAGARARKTVERILASTAALLDEVGFNDLTTNLIAERAGVRMQRDLENALFRQLEKQQRMIGELRNGDSKETANETRD